MRRYLELVVDDEEIVGTEGLGQRVRLTAQLPDVVGVREARKVGVLRRPVLGVRRGRVSVPLRIDLELAQGVRVALGSWFRTRCVGCPTSCASMSS